jgi:hypothetical protein
MKGIKIKLFLLMFLVFTFCSKEQNDNKSKMSIQIFSKTNSDTLIYVDISKYDKSFFTKDMYYRYFLTDSESKIEYYAFSNHISYSFNNQAIKDSFCLSKLIWNWVKNDTEREIEFGALKPDYYNLEISLYNNRNGRIKSNYLTLKLNFKTPVDTINAPPDTSNFINYYFIDINNNNYNLREITAHKKVLFVGFFTNCVWCQKEAPLINKIDSIYNSKIQIIGYEITLPKNSDDIQKFISKFQIKYPVCSRENNIDLLSLIFPDNVLSVPRITIVNNHNEIIFTHIGYNENIIDTIGYYLK